MTHIISQGRFILRPTVRLFYAVKTVYFKSVSRMFWKLFSTLWLVTNSTARKIFDKKEIWCEYLDKMCIKFSIKIRFLQCLKPRSSKTSFWIIIWAFQLSHFRNLSLYLSIFDLRIFLSSLRLQKRGVANKLPWTQLILTHQVLLSELINLIQWCCFFNQFWKVSLRSIFLFFG